MNKKDAYYFSHDSNAQHDPKILHLRTIMGWEGYGLYFAFLEKCRDQKNYMYSSNAKATLKLAFGINEETLNLFFKVCFEINLLKENNGFIFSESFVNRMLLMDERRNKYVENGRKGGLRSNAKATLKKKLSIAQAIKGKEIKGKGKEKEIKEKEKGKETKEEERVFELYSSICHSLPKIIKKDQSRKRLVRVLLKEFSLEEIETIFRKCESSGFLRGDNDRSWRPDFDWIMKLSNARKILEGRYDFLKTNKEKNDSFESFAENHGMINTSKKKEDIIDL